MQEHVAAGFCLADGKFQGGSFQSVPARPAPWKVGMRQAATIAKPRLQFALPVDHVLSWHRRLPLPVSTPHTARVQADALHLIQALRQAQASLRQRLETEMQWSSGRWLVSLSEIIIRLLEKDWVTTPAMITCNLCLHYGTDNTHQKPSVGCAHAFAENACRG